MLLSCRGNESYGESIFTIFFLIGRVGEIYDWQLVNMSSKLNLFSIRTFEVGQILHFFRISQHYPPVSVASREVADLT